MQPSLVDERNVALMPGRRLALPVGTDQQVEALLGAVHRADIAERIGALIGGLEHEEALAEIRHLYDHGSRREIENAEAVDQVLTWASDVALPWVIVVDQHPQAIDRRHRSNATHQPGLGLDPALCPIAVVDVDQRPRPEIGEAPNLARKLRRQLRAEYRPGGDGARLVRGDDRARRRDRTHAPAKPKSFQQGS